MEQLSASPQSAQPIRFEAFTASSITQYVTMSYLDVLVDRPMTKDGRQGVLYAVREQQ